MPASGKLVYNNKKEQVDVILKEKTDNLWGHKDLRKGDMQWNRLLLF